MSGEPGASGGSGSSPAAANESGGRLRLALARTRRGLRAALSDPVGRAVLAGSTLAYLLAYAVAAGDLGLASTRTRAAGGSTLGLDVVTAPVSRALAGEAVALATLGPVEYLLDPTTTATGLALGALVGANLALSALAYRRPAVCSVSPTSGLAAGLPALLSGTACCGPLVFVVLGVQATSAALTAVAWLRPAAALLLVASLVWAGWRLDVRPAGSQSSSGKMLSGM